jgi:phage shock protein A
MTIFTRLNDIINSNINNLLDKAEKPDNMIRLIIQEMEEALVEIRSTSAQHIAEKKSLLRQKEGFEKSAQRWEQKAELALTKQAESLARSALIEKQKYLAQLPQIQSQLNLIEQNLNLIQEDSARLQSKLTDAKKQKETLRLRQASAVARLKAKESLNSHMIDDSIIKFEQFQQKIEKIEASVEAFELTQSSDLASQIDQLARNSVVETELEALKQRLAKAS